MTELTLVQGLATLEAGRAADAREDMAAFADQSSSACSAERFPSRTPESCCALGFCKCCVCAPWQGSCPAPCPSGQGRAPLGNFPVSGWRQDGVSPGKGRPTATTTVKGCGCWECLPALIRGAGPALIQGLRGGQGPVYLRSHACFSILSLSFSLNTSGCLFTPRQSHVLSVCVSPSPQGSRAGECCLLPQALT